MIQYNKPRKAFANILDNIFDTSFNDLVGANITHTRPAVNILDTDEGYLLEVAAAGLEKDSFDISVKNKELTVSANVSASESGNDEHIKVEYDYRNFTRKFSMSGEVDTEKISAKYDNGVLRILLNKKNIPEEEQVKKVVIV